MHIAASIFVLFLLFTASLVQAAEYPPQDHAGSDLTLAGGDVIWGEHTGIGTFSIPKDSAVRVGPYDGTTTSGIGTVTIRANQIVIHGRLVADGAGYTGGGGGGGGAAAYDESNTRGMGGTARYGNARQGGRDGNPRTYLGVGMGLPGSGGSGGVGDGPGRGVIATYVVPPEGPADYRLDGIAMGSGADGRAGGHGNMDSSSPETGSGGGAGGSGGGAIRLYARETLQLLDDAVISANGTFPREFSLLSDRRRIDGVNVDDPIQSAVSGSGPGSGGGILLSCERGPVIIGRFAMVNSYAGAPRTTNGGTIRLLMDSHANYHVPHTVRGGSVQLGPSRANTEFPPQDHANQSLVLDDGDVIWGEHTGIDRFEIRAGARVRVKPYDGVSTDALGTVTIRAREVRLLGTLDATGAGHTGGAGGGGGGYAYGNLLGGPVGGALGSPGGRARYGAGNHDGREGGPGAPLSMWMIPGQGGAGGPGDGPGRGESGAYVSPDPTSGGGLSVWMGSGADGASGKVGSSSATPGRNGAGGESGGSGGGAIRIYAGNSLVLAPGSAILAHGTTARRHPYDELAGYSSDGVHVDDDNVPPIATGTGAGGGIHLHSARNPIVLQTGARIETLGGGSQSGNGGTLILTMPNPPSLEAIAEAVSAGNVEVHPLAPPPADTSGFMLN